MTSNQVRGELEHCPVSSYQAAVSHTAQKCLNWCREWQGNKGLYLHLGGASRAAQSIVRGNKASRQLEGSRAAVKAGLLPVPLTSAVSHPEIT